MAVGKVAGQAPLVAHSGCILIHVHDVATLDVVLQAAARLGALGKPGQQDVTSCGAGNLPHELVYQATQTATELLCTASHRRAHGLQQALAPWRQRTRPGLAKDLREFHVAVVVCRRATTERFDGLLGELKAFLGGSVSKAGRTRQNAVVAVERLRVMGPAMTARLVGRRGFPSRSLRTRPAKAMKAMR